MNLTSDELVAVHAEQRAKERYGIELTESDRDDMVDQVKNGRGLFFKKKDGSSKVSIWLVWWRAASRIVPIYYKASRVLTVLPADAFFGPSPARQIGIQTITPATSTGADARPPFQFRTTTPPENHTTVTEAAKRYLAAIDSDPENDIWDTWDGKPAEGALKTASDASWAGHGQKIEARLSELRAALAATEGQP